MNQVMSKTAELDTQKGISEGLQLFLQENMGEADFASAQAAMESDSTEALQGVTHMMLAKRAIDICEITEEQKSNMEKVGGGPDWFVRRERALQRVAERPPDEQGIVGAIAHAAAQGSKGPEASENPEPDRNQGDKDLQTGDAEVVVDIIDGDQIQVKTFNKNEMNMIEIGGRTLAQVKQWLGCDGGGNGDEPNRDLSANDVAALSFVETTGARQTLVRALLKETGEGEETG